VSIVFENPPPPPAPAHRRWHARLEPLKARPHEWARVYVTSDYQKASSYAWQLKKRDRYALPSGDFEFRAARLEDGRGAVYARYLA
jgi:hypothetical protein